MTEGLLGEVTDLLEDATELAIDNNANKIDEELLRSMDWVLPSARSG